MKCLNYINNVYIYKLKYEQFSKIFGRYYNNFQFHLRFKSYKYSKAT